MKNRAKKEQRVSFRLERELKERLFAAAVSKDRTASWIVQKCLKRALPEIEKQPSFDAAHSQHVSLAV